MKKILFLLVSLFLLSCIPVCLGLGFIAWQVYIGNYSDFEKSRIIDILSKETVLYYADGQSQLGSLFGQEHRIYVNIDQIPNVMKDAIVTAEDEDFYTNIGIDPKGILRAIINNMLFKTRQGASTITQQTVKNLFGRKETDLYVKFQEMINAFKLEKMYSKNQILEFYLNQFHVTGNGRGIGVASKYYFNKNVEDLSLIESAFIAGSVKGPEKYNPFTKTNLAAQEKAQKEAFIRKNYVLDRMYKSEKITQEQYEDALNKPVPFNQGRFQFNELAVNQIISKQLARPEVLSAIGATHVDEVGTMGLHITTTLEKEIQAAAQYGLRQNLSRIQLILNGFRHESQSTFSNIQKPELYGFYVGKIESINREPNNEYLKISFGIPNCTIHKEALQRVSLITDQPFRRGLQKAQEALLNSLEIGQYVLTSISTMNTDGQMFCDLETRPRIQGAAIVLDKGKIIAMAGGFSSSEYNRAIFAKRQPGSSFKLTTFYAAQQLGWSVLDPLPNIRDVFTWQGEFYFPRPDHRQNTLETTILGAGAKSENLASVWLMKHLTDKLNYDQYLDLLHFLELTGTGKTPEQSLNLIKKRFHASPENESYIKSGVLQNIKQTFISDLSILSNNKLRIFLRTLHLGTRFQKQEELIQDDKDLSIKEKEIRCNILKNNLIRWNKISLQAKKALTILHHAIHDIDLPESDRELLTSFAANNEGKLAFLNKKDQWDPYITSDLVEKTSLMPLSIDALIARAKENSALLNPSQILLDGVVPLSLLETIQTEFEKKWKEIQKINDPLEKLYWNADFRYSLGMYYAAKMANDMGVQQSLRWVPSFPLGSNDVTLSELALMYQTFLNGKTYRYFNTPQPNQLVLIKRIEDARGNLLWEAKAKEYQFADPFYSPAILNTLRGTVTAGTAYVLNNSIILRSKKEDIDKQLQNLQIRIPSFGKTGTTNDFRNGTYIGFLPYPSHQGEYLSPENAYTIASYIGYDSNEPMVRKNYRVYGGGAIPAWEEIALSIIKDQNFADKIDWKTLANKKIHNLSFNYGTGLSQVVVPINSWVSISSQDLDENTSTASVNPYANDYSDTGQRLFKIYLPGSTSDGIFIPKRKVSLYTPFTLNANNAPMQFARPEEDSQESPFETTLPTGLPVTPAPLASFAQKQEAEESTFLNSEEEEDLSLQKEETQRIIENDKTETLPEAPPQLKNQK